MREAVLSKLAIEGSSFDIEVIQGALADALALSEKYEINFSSSLEILDYLAPFKPDTPSIIALLYRDLYLQDFIDEDYLQAKCGLEVMSMLSGLKKLSNLRYKENDKGTKIDSLRKMFLVMAKDIRVIVIGLVCRLYEMEKLSKTKSESYAIAKETMEVYVPIADRLGMYLLKTNLEDIAFSILSPVEHKAITSQLKQFGKIKKGYIAMIKYSLDKFLKQQNFDDFSVSGRIKGVYSIYKKLKRKGHTSIDSLHDVFAIRVVLPSQYDENFNELVDHLYGVLGVIHSEWTPVSKRFKDYIAVPKPNGYRSLHTVVLGLAPKDYDQPVEIQIRSSSMHYESEYGVASHWVYKDKNTGAGRGDSATAQVEWLKGLQGVHEDFRNEYEIMHEVEVDIFKDRIFVLTPKGEVKDLPIGAVPIDFAYSIHTDVGNKCVMAKVDGVIQPLDYELKNGDVVEIITKKGAEPKRQWLSFVRTRFAKNKIKGWISGLNRAEHLKQGRILLNKQLQLMGKPLLDQNYSILKSYAGQGLGLPEREILLQEIGKGSQVAIDVVKKVYPEFLVGKRVNVPPKAALSESDYQKAILIGGQDNMMLKVGKCCTPKYRDPIVGYITRAGQATIHRLDCMLLDTLRGERMLFAQWKGENDFDETRQRVRLKITVDQQHGFVRPLSSVISDMGVDIFDLIVKRGGNAGLYDDFFVLGVRDEKQLKEVMGKLKKVAGVMGVGVDRKNG